MDIKNRRYRTFTVNLDSFLDDDGQFKATTILQSFDSNMKQSKDAILNDSTIEAFYQNAINTTIRNSMDCVAGIFITFQDEDLFTKSISIADVAYISDLLNKVCDLEAAIQSCIQTIDTYTLGSNVGSNVKSHLELLKERLGSLSTFITMIIRRFTVILGLYKSA